jgi:hypothetical protein
MKMTRNGFITFDCLHCGRAAARKPKQRRHRDDGRAPLLILMPATASPAQLALSSRRALRYLRISTSRFSREM